MSTLPAFFQEDDLFKRFLADGHKYAGRVAAFLHGQGLDVELTPMRFRETFEDRHEFVDEFDLIVKGLRNIRLEVKSRDLSFSDPDDYPYPTAFVDTVKGWHARTHPPSAIILISQRTSLMCVIPRSTQEHWTQEARYDWKRGYEDLFYMVAREHLVGIYDLVNWLKRITLGEM